ncbi:MAG: hypothetical protein ACYDC2_08770, partial [Solirubrobacteraceae bacterium]
AAHRGARAVIALLFFEVLLILCLIAAIIVWQRPAARAEAGAAISRGVAPALDAEQDLAASLGVPFGAWATIRLTLLGIALLVGWVSGVAVIAVILLLLGTVGVPWLVEDVAAARRSRANRSLVATVRDVANGLQRMGNLDAVLREVVQHPRPELRALLVPLAERSRSPFVEDVCVLLLAGRTRDPRELVHQLRDQVVPELEEDIALLDATRAAVAVQRRSAQMIGAVLAVLIGAFNTVPVLHDFLVSGQGEVTLVVAAVIFAGSIAAMGALLRPPRPVRWDVRLVRAELGRLGRG